MENPNGKPFILYDSEPITSGQTHIADIFSAWFSTKADDIGKPYITTGENTILSLIEWHGEHPSVA